MTSYRRSAWLPHLWCAGESRGAYDPDPGDADRDRGRGRGGGDPGDGGREADGAGRPPRDADDPGPAGGSPLGGLVDAIDGLEAAKRRLLDRLRDVAAWGGTATTTGYTQGEYLTLVGRLAGSEVWRYQQLVRRLPGLPVTAALLESGQLTFDQALSIVAGTRGLSGDALADVERTAAEAAVARNRRGDDPDIEAAVRPSGTGTWTAPPAASTCRAHPTATTSTPPTPAAPHPNTSPQPLPQLLLSRLGGDPQKSTDPDVPHTATPVGTPVLPGPDITTRPAPRPAATRATSSP